MDALDEHDRNSRDGEAREEILGDELHNHEAARGDAGIAVVEAGAETEGADDEVKIGVGENQHGVLAGEFHHGWRIRFGECREDIAAVFGGAGEDHFVHAVGDGAARGGYALGKDGEQSGIEAGVACELREGERDVACAGRGLEQDGVARDERVQRVHGGQEKRVVCRADHENEAEGLALHFKGHALHPEWTSAASASACGEHAVCSFFQPATGVGEREDFGDEFLGDGTTAHRSSGGGESVGVFCDAVPQRAHDFETLDDRCQRPARLSGAGFGMEVRIRFRAWRERRVHHASSRFGGASSGAGATAGSMPRSASSSRELMRALSKITGRPLPGCVPPPTR